MTRPGWRKGMTLRLSGSIPAPLVLLWVDALNGKSPSWDGQNAHTQFGVPGCQIDANSWPRHGECEGGASYRLVLQLCSIGVDG